MSHNHDVVIIGGGINGVCTAFYLANRGILVTLLEKSFIAGGPTGRSSAIVRQHYSHRVTALMAFNSLRIWQNFPEITGANPVFTQTGMMVGVRENDIESLQANILMQQSLGIDTRFVNVEEMLEIEPHLNTRGLAGGAFERESGYCDPSLAANGFSQAAKNLGATILTGTRAAGFSIEGGKVRGVVTEAGIINADAVIIAAGPWSSTLLQKIGIVVPIITARVKTVIYKPPADLIHHSIWTDFIAQVYLRPETGGMMLVGSISPDEEMGDQVLDPDHFNETVGIEIISSFAERVALRYNAMQRSHVASSYASLYDITPDWHPIIDAVPGIEGLYLCAGTSGHGFKLGPAVGEMLADLVVNGKSPDDDVNIFSFDRFETGNLIRGKYEYSILA